MSLSLDIVFGRTRVVLWGGSGTGIRDWLSLHASESEPPAALIYIRPLTKAALIRLSNTGDLPRIIISPRCDAVRKGEERLMDFILWETRKNGFLHLDMYPDGRLIINNEN